MKISLLLFFISLAIICPINAQNTNEIFCKLVDSETSEPVSFCTVLIKDSNLGVIADYNGEFRMPIKYYENSSSLIISSIGYRTEEVALKTLKLNKINVIKIRPQIEALDAVIINSRSKIRGRSYNSSKLVRSSRAMTAKEIVLKAIKNIPQNLSNKPHSYIGYYRDYQLVDNKFHNLNEAIFETFDGGISTDFLEENSAPTAIYSFKQNTNFIQDASLTKAYNGVTKYIENAQISPRGGNEYTILNTHNPIRNFNTSTFSYVYTLEKDFPNLHDFKRDKIVYLNDEPLALIKFKNNKKRNYNAYGVKTQTKDFIQGSIYISLVDYSIHRFNYKALNPGSKDVLFNVSLEYARQDNHMYLNYITFNNAFVVGEDFQLREEKVEFDNSEQAFYVTFNNTEDFLNTETLSKNNFKFKLDKTRLKTVAVEKISERVVKVSVERFNGNLIGINKKNINDLSYTFKRIEDVTGRVIYKIKSIKGDQFREFFVQKVNLNKSIPKGLKLMKQNTLIKESLLNTWPDANQYWINSPLMNEKYREVNN